VRTFFSGRNLYTSVCANVGIAFHVHVHMQHVVRHNIMRRGHVVLGRRGDTGRRGTKRRGGRGDYFRGQAVIWGCGWRGGAALRRTCVERQSSQRQVFVLGTGKEQFFLFHEAVLGHVHLCVVCVRKCVCVCVRMREGMYVHAPLCVGIHACIYVWIHVFMFVIVCVYVRVCASA